MGVNFGCISCLSTRIDTDPGCYSQIENRNEDVVQGHLLSFSQESSDSLSEITGLVAVPEVTEESTTKVVQMSQLSLSFDND